VAFTRPGEKVYTTMRKIRQMEVKRRNFTLYAILACIVGYFAGPLLAQEDEMYWLDNYAEALKEAKRTQKPIFLEFRCEP
jgi:hypothetical protein